MERQSHPRHVNYVDQEERNTIGVLHDKMQSPVEYECREARERGIRPPSKRHSEIPSAEPFLSRVEKEEPSPLDDTPSVDSTHLLEDESSTLSSTFGVNEATVSDSENSPVATECNDDPNGILDDNDNFILADDGILDGFQCTAIGRGEEQQMVYDPTSASCSMPLQEDPMNPSQQGVYSFNWEPSPFLSGNDGACDYDYPFTSFSIPFENNNVY